MNLQKTLLATLAGFIGLFGLGYLIYVLLFPGMNCHSAIADTDMFRDYFPGIIAFEIVYAFLVTYIFQKWAGIKTFMGGLKGGIMIGLLLGLAGGLWSYSTMTAFCWCVIWWYALTFAIRFGIAGGLIGWVLGKE